jgi:hypothetical protein
MKGLRKTMKFVSIACLRPATFINVLEEVHALKNRNDLQNCTNRVFLQAFTKWPTLCKCLSFYALRCASYGHFCRKRSLTLNSAIYRYLTTAMELSPSREAASCAAIQELTSISWNPTVQYRVHNSPPPIPILSHINPFHTITSYLSKIHLNIIHPYCLCLSSGLFLSDFPNKNLHVLLFSPFMLLALPIASFLSSSF